MINEVKRKYTIERLLHTSIEIDDIYDYCEDCFAVDDELKKVNANIKMYTAMYQDALQAKIPWAVQNYGEHIRKLMLRRDYILEYDTDCVKHYSAIGIVITPYD